jgi:DNA repair protein RecO (recombination protein O)
VETAHGILIRRTLLTDTSLIVHWLTREQGIVRTAARGARRPGSVFGGKLDLFYSADIAFVRGRRGDLHALREVGVTAYRQGIQASYARVLCAAYFASLIDLVVEKDAPALEGHQRKRWPSAERMTRPSLLRVAGGLEGKSDQAAPPSLEK